MTVAECPANKYCFCSLFEPGPGGSGGPREAPRSPAWAFPGPPGASRMPPGPKTNQSKKSRSLAKLIEQWSDRLLLGRHAAVRAAGTKPSIDRDPKAPSPLNGHQTPSTPLTIV